jgi:predicted RNase H-like nuclease (RuvC/YqgF family)
MSSVPRPPSANKRVQEALQLFSELQSVSIADIHDGDRLRTSSAPSNAARPAAPVAPPKPSGGKKAPSQSHVEELKHKVNVADAIMKRLHKKNQELIAQLESRGDHSATAQFGDSTSVVAQLRKDIANRDREIQQLKSSLRTNGQRDDAIPSSSRVLQQLHDIERGKLNKQYNSLAESKLEYIAQGESTGKVNKEVKLFFQAMKQKLLDDAIYYDASRAALNESLFDAEYKLASAAL